MIQFEKTLVNDSEIAWQDLGNGIKRKIMSYNDHVMLVKFDLEKGAIGTLHHHPHLQISYVASGIFEVIINGESKNLHEGDVYFVPSDAIHGVICLEKGMLIDVFSPMREDFIA